MSPSVVHVLLQFVVVALIMFIANPSNAYYSAAGKLRSRDNYLDSTRFFIPNALLADQLLNSAGPIRAIRPAAFDRPPSPAKRYFDSLAGQSLGKRSAPLALEEVSRSADNDDDDKNGARFGTPRIMMRLNALRPGWQMW